MVFFWLFNTVINRTTFKAPNVEYFAINAFRVAVNVSLGHYLAQHDRFNSHSTVWYLSLVDIIGGSLVFHKIWFAVVHRVLFVVLAWNWLLLSGRDSVETTVFAGSFSTRHVPPFFSRRTFVSRSVVWRFSSRVSV